MKINTRIATQQGYTLVELVVATGILMMGSIAAYHMAANANRVEEMNLRLTRGFNMQDNYAKLWQLGLAPAQITDVVLPRSNEVSFSSTAANPALPAIGPMDGLEITATLNSGAVAGVSRPNTITVYRATR